jgi:hypothetical protein
MAVSIKVMVNWYVIPCSLINISEELLPPYSILRTKAADFSESTDAYLLIGIQNCILKDCNLSMLIQIYVVFRST